ncbi:TerB family tellurite resistance protein [uncultured Erythrobacter sp.]|uniref:tellurite resistance TerB family protein n=1 Tax=uncultured Erythrobacter sp. TaxID=263913 RepID=UPI002633A8C1|nr:TerB family tellurite resistance protein [uncultured Erythrobacter sp.]
MNSNTLIGALFFFGGLFVTFATYSAAEGGGNYVLAWGAILFGGIQMVMGLAQGSDEGEAQQLTPQQVEAAGTSVILRSMISMAAADGKLDEEEVGMIRVVSRSVFGSELGEDTIRDMSAKMISGRGDISQELASVADIVSWEDADLAVTGMAMVAMADGNMDEAETARLEDYAGALGVDQERFDRALEKARVAVAQIFAPKAEGEAQAPAADAAPQPG